MKIGGEGGDRTHGPVARTAAFEAARFGHSRTSPFGGTRPTVGGWIEYIVDIVVAMGYAGAYPGGGDFSIGFLFPRCALVFLDPWS